MIAWMCANLQADEQEEEDKRVEAQILAAKSMPSPPPPPPAAPPLPATPAEHCQIAKGPWCGPYYKQVCAPCAVQVPGPRQAGRTGMHGLWPHAKGAAGNAGGG